MGRYYSLHDYNQSRYGRRVFKASLDCGCTCPNRDGTVGKSGCIYCDSGSRYFSGSGTVSEQLDAEARRIHEKWPDARLIAYFQAGTNTYGDLRQLQNGWEQAVNYPGVVGVSIATRADCLGGAVLDALTELRGRTDLTVELGLQTACDETAENIGRGHSFAQFLDGYRALQTRGIRTCVHLIDGLPGETRDTMLLTARRVGELRPGGVKLHLLHVNEGTGLVRLWRAGGYQPLEKETYVDIVTEQLRYIPKETVIERLTGDGDRQRLLAPLWSRDKISVLGAIEHALKEKNAVQGDRFSDGRAE